MVVTGEPTHTASKASRPQVYQLFSEMWSRHYASLPAVFNLLCSNMNQQLFEKNLCNQSSHYENYRQFLLWIEAITCLPQIPTLFMMSKDEWDTKEGTGKSLKNALHAQWYQKRPHLRLKCLAIVELRLSVKYQKCVQVKTSAMAQDASVPSVCFYINCNTCTMCCAFLHWTSWCCASSKKTRHYAANETRKVRNLVYGNSWNIS